MLRGLASVVGEEALTAVVNTGDDVVLHGLYVSPDIDTVTYTLGGVNNPETGWGLASESWAVMRALRAFDQARFTWFSLGDKDLATHLFRTGLLASGATLSQVTAAVARRFCVRVCILPMSDQRVQTRVTVKAGSASAGDGGEVEIGFQEYFVGLRHAVPVTAVRFVGAADAQPAPGVLEAIDQAETIIICPSNPFVSIGPILSLPALSTAVARRRERVVAVSPIIAGRALKGPADRMLAELGHDTSVVGVADLWAPFASTLVVDEADASLASEVEARGMRCVVTPSVMSSPAEAANLARAALAAPGLRV